MRLPGILLPPMIAALAGGCVLERGPPADPDERGIPRSIEEREEPGTIFTLRRARADIVDCIHCGSPNAPGRERCAVCDRPMAVDVFVPCPDCSSITDPDLRAECPRCGGRGFLEAPGEGGEDGGEVEGRP